MNRSGQFNSPYGRHKSPNIVNERGVRAVSTYLRSGVDIMCDDFSCALHDLPRGSFVYLDPPYMPVSKTSAFTSYTGGGFSYDDHVRLRDECLSLRERGIGFVESGSDCEAVRTLYADFTIREVRARRSINSRGDRRGEIGELLISW